MHDDHATHPQEHPPVDAPPSRAPAAPAEGASDACDHAFLQATVGLTEEALDALCVTIAVEADIPVPEAIVQEARRTIDATPNAPRPQRRIPEPHAAETALQEAAEALDSAASQIDPPSQTEHAAHDPPEPTAPDQEPAMTDPASDPMPPRAEVSELPQDPPESAPTPEFVATDPVAPPNEPHPAEAAIDDARDALERASADLDPALLDDLAAQMATQSEPAREHQVHAPEPDALDEADRVDHPEPVTEPTGLTEPSEPDASEAIEAPPAPPAEPVDRDGEPPAESPADAPDSTSVDDAPESEPAPAKPEDLSAQTLEDLEARAGIEDVDDAGVLVPDEAMRDADAPAAPPDVTPTDATPDATPEDPEQLATSLADDAPADVPEDIPGTEPVIHRDDEPAPPDTEPTPDPDFGVNLDQLAGEIDDLLPSSDELRATSASAHLGIQDALEAAAVATPEPTPEPTAEDEPAVEAPEPEPQPEPARDPEPIEAPDHAVDAEADDTPEAITETEPPADPEPVDATTEPEPDPEPIADPDEHAPDAPTPASIEDVDSMLADEAEGVAADLEPATPAAPEPVSSPSASEPSPPAPEAPAAEPAREPAAQAAADAPNTDVLATLRADLPRLAATLERKPPAVRTLAARTHALAMPALRLVSAPMTLVPEEHRAKVSVVAGITLANACLVWAFVIATRF
jgi:hypothetical protein